MLLFSQLQRPGGNFGLGFVADRKRQCVALSRARDGLVIIGDEKMGDNARPESFKAWKLIWGPATTPNPFKLTEIGIRNPRSINVGISILPQPLETGSMSS